MECKVNLTDGVNENHCSCNVTSLLCRGSLACHVTRSLGRIAWCDEPKNVCIGCYIVTNNLPITVPISLPFICFTIGGLRPDIHDLKKGIQFKDVHYAYLSRSDMPIFRGLDLEVPAGSVTAVVGPSGSGKSTLGSLLLRLYDPVHGQVIVGGHDVRALSPDWLRGAIGTVHQVQYLMWCKTMLFRWKIL